MTICRSLNSNSEMGIAFDTTDLKEAKALLDQLSE
jgi:hypothetical protein